MSNREKKSNDTKVKKRVVIQDPTPQTPGVRTQPRRGASTPKPIAAGKSGAVKKKNQDPAPAPLSVKKDLVVATPKADRNARKRKQKDEETSGDDEADEEAPSSELSDDEGGAEATDEFATVIRGPPTVTDGEDIAEETDDEQSKKRKRLNGSPIPAPQKSARKDGQTAPTRQVSVDASEPAKDLPSAAVDASEPAKDLPSAAPAKPEAAAPVTTPSLETVAGASPLKKLTPATGAKALLANAEKMQKKLEARYVSITDEDSDAPTQPPNKTQKEAETAKAKQEDKRKRKKEKGKQKEKEPKKQEKSRTKSTDVDMDEADDVKPTKGKEREPKKQEKSKTKSTDVDMDEADNVKPTKGKHLDAPTKREKALEAEVERLRQLVKQKKQSDNSTQPDSDASERDESSEGDDDAKPTKKGKGPAKNAKATTTESSGSSESSEEEDTKLTKKGKGPVKRAKPGTQTNPELYSYYKAQKGDIAEVASDLKMNFLRRIFVDWWPEESVRIAYGQDSYDEAVKKFKSVLVISSSDEEYTSAQKAKFRRKAPIKYNSNMRRVVSKFPTEFRNNVRNAVVDAVEGAYEIRKTPEDFSGEPVDYTRNRVRGLLNDFAFAVEPNVPNAIIGSHPTFIQLLVKHFGKAEFMAESKIVEALNPMPLECIAIMVAAVHYSLERFSDGSTGSKIAFQETIYKAIYNIVVQTLAEAQKNKAAQYSALMDKYRTAMPAIGANSRNARSVAKEALEEEEVEEVEEEVEEVEGEVEDMVEDMKAEADE